jgi:hypothetical protein
MTYHLTKQTEAAARLRERLVAEFGEDHDLVRDMIEGETDLHRQLSIAATELAYVEGVKAGINETLAKIKERLSRYARQAETIRAAIETAMTVAEIDKLPTPAATLSMGKSPPRVEITDPDALPPVYVTQPAPFPDKRAIAAALKAGEAVPGAALSNQPPALSVRFT